MLADRCGPSDSFLAAMMLHMKGTTMGKLLAHKSQRCGGPRGTINGARLSIGGKMRESLRIALREDAALAEFVSVFYDPEDHVLVIDKEQNNASRLQVRRGKSENRTSYPVILISMKGDTPVKFKTQHSGAVNCELKALDDGRLAISVPAHFTHVPGGAQ